MIKGPSQCEIKNFESILNQQEIVKDEKLSKTFPRDSKIYPVLELAVIESVVLEKSSIIKINPFSVNDRNMNVPDKVIFGRDLDWNTYNFPDVEKNNQKQFEIIFEHSI